jgi:glutaredoxin
MTAPPQEGTQLALYQTRWCPYCMRVQRAIEEMGLDVEVRDLRKDRQWERELVQARGRRTVPVLRITDAQGRDEWLPESLDIIQWLRQNYQ